MSYDTVDQWLDWGDHTVTVDPIRQNQYWIYEQGGTESGHRHRVSVARGRGLDAKETKHLMGLLEKQDTSTTYFFTPSADELERLPKFPSRRNGDCDVWRGQLRDVRGVGSLPIIAQKHREMNNTRTKGEIERSVYHNNWGISSRVFSKGGVPDHGLPC